MAGLEEEPRWPTEDRASASEERTPTLRWADDDPSNASASSELFSRSDYSSSNSRERSVSSISSRGGSTSQRSSSSSFFSSLRRGGSHSSQGRSSNSEASSERGSSHRRVSDSAKLLVLSWISQPVETAGVLKKKSSSHGRWQRRYFQIRGPLLLYWRSEEVGLNLTRSP